MALNLGLTSSIRAEMLAELDHDLEHGCLYLSPRLSLHGREVYPSLLQAAFTHGDDWSLELELGGPGILEETETARNPRGGPPVVKRVPVNAACMLAEGEFNRFYLRGLCIEALSLGIETVVVYRAKETRNPRSASVAMIGTEIVVTPLLADLRSNIGVDTALGLPPGPNSGLSACLPDSAERAA